MRKNWPTKKNGTEGGGGVIVAGPIILVGVWICEPIIDVVEERHGLASSSASWIGADITGCGAVVHEMGIAMKMIPW
jgi:hypothetical protein